MACLFLAASPVRYLLKYFLFLQKHPNMAAPAKALQAHRPACPGLRNRSILTCRAQATRAPKAAPSNPKNSIGIHSQVWVGGWNPQEAEKAISGTKEAGFDLIECEALRLSLIQLALSLQELYISVTFRCLEARILDKDKPGVLGWATSVTRKLWT